MILTTTVAKTDIFDFRVEKNSRILGVHILGSYTSEMIWGASTLIENEMRVEDVKQLIFPHPTVCEAIREAVWAL